MPTRRNHAAWLGPVLVLTGVLSYFLVFARWPALRDFPWVNLPWVALGLVLAVQGTRRVFRERGWIAKALTTSTFALSLVLAGLWAFYVFAFSYGLPEAPAARTMAAAPAFTLEDQLSRPVSLVDLRGSKVVLVFFRGDW